MNVLGVPADEHLNIRISMVIAALWLGGFAIPVILHPPLPKKMHTGGDHESIFDSYVLLWRTVRTLSFEARTPSSSSSPPPSSVTAWPASSPSERFWPRRPSVSARARS